MKTLTAILSIFIFIIAISYLSWWSTENKGVITPNNRQKLVQACFENINTMIESCFSQYSMYFNRFNLDLKNEKNDIQCLLETQNSIQNYLKIEKNKISCLITSNHKHWTKLTEPIKYEKATLSNRSIISELFPAKFGWYQDYNHIIYWLIKDNNIIGSEFYSINRDIAPPFFADKVLIANHFILFNYDKQSHSKEKLYNNNIKINFDYISPYWKVLHYFETKSLTYFYAFFVFLIILFTILLILTIIYFYRKYFQTLCRAEPKLNLADQLSHEFKIPLTNIILYSEILKEKLSNEPCQLIDYIDVIICESKRLTRLVQNVLTFNKMIKLNIKPVNITKLVRQVYSTFKPVFDSKSLQFNLIINSKKECFIDTDEDSVVHIICNFLNNAEKYASDGKKVDLVLNKQKNKIMVTVRDYGKGIPNHLLEQMFRPFYSINLSSAEGLSGTGIGLTIAKQLANNLNATIEVTNQKPGVAFSLILTE